MLPSPSFYNQYWNLNPNIAYLNHGSFGATPTYILDKQREYMKKLEADPTNFSVKLLYPIYWENKIALAKFLGTSENNIYFVPNTTIGVNHILHNQRDTNKIWMTTNHAYGACLNALNTIAKDKNCQTLKITISYPIHSEEDILQKIEDELKYNTSLVMIDYISSASAIIFPIKKIINLCHSKGIKVLIDGAHAPGFIDFNIDELEVDYFVGNCHKWMCTPKGSAFVYVNPKYQKDFKPIYTGFFNDTDIENERHWSNQFIWEGTKDYSAYLCLKDAIEYLPKLTQKSWEDIMAQNRNLAINAAQYIAEKLSVALPVPKNMCGAMVNIPVWDDIVPTISFNHYTQLKEILFNHYQIEVPCFLFPSAPTQYLRISAQIYNSIEQYHYLADTLLKIRG